MSERSKRDSLAEENLGDEQVVHGQGSMLFTMLLLTAGFVFTSTLLIHQSLKARSAEGHPIFVLSALIEKGKSLTPPPPSIKREARADSGKEASPLKEIQNMVLGQKSDDTVKWPKLRMTGFGKSADGTEEFAIINGELVHPGEFAGKVKLIEVRAHNVIVEYNGERRTLAVGLKD